MRYLAVAALLTFASSAAAADPARGLDIYFIDTEGGAATLLVTPAGEALLIDCGNPGARDAERIHKTATEQAKLAAIDHLAITHWHLDHYGGADRLAKLMPVKNFYDRGIPDTLDEDKRNFPTLIQAYKAASGGKSKALKPGDTLALKQRDGSPPLSVRVLCASGAVVADKPGAADNPVAKDHTPQPADPSDNAKSLGFLVSFGGFRFLDLGDLTWNVEYKLVAPTDKIGPIDLYQTTHHGLEISNNPVLMRTVRPRVAVFNNGPRKGCHPSVTAALRRIPDVQAIYQLHKNLNAAAQENTDTDKIANPEGKSGQGIKVAVAADGKSYRVVVGTREDKTYTTRGEP